MNDQDLKKVAAKLPLSAATLARNQHLTEPQIRSGLKRLRECSADGSRLIRQDKPVKEGQWEKEWRERIEESGEFTHVKAQSLRFRLASGAWFKPDISAMRCADNVIHCWDVKGGSKMKGTAKGRLAIKVAASLYPEFTWALCWKERGEWKIQKVVA